MVRKPNRNQSKLLLKYAAADPNPIQSALTSNQSKPSRVKNATQTNPDHSFKPVPNQFKTILYNSVPISVCFLTTGLATNEEELAHAQRRSSKRHPRPRRWGCRVGERGRRRHQHFSSARVLELARDALNDGAGEHGERRRHGRVAASQRPREFARSILGDGLATVAGGGGGANARPTHYRRERGTRERAARFGRDLPRSVRPGEC